MSAAASGAAGDGFCLGPEDGIPEGTVRVFQVDGTEVGVLRVVGELRAFENHCPHQGGPVCLGEVLGRQEAVLDERRRIVRERLSGERFDLICPWHGYSFDALSGECVVDRRLRLRPWDVAVRGGQVYVGRGAPEKRAPAIAGRPRATGEGDGTWTATCCRTPRRRPGGGVSTGCWSSTPTSITCGC